MIGVLAIIIAIVFMICLERLFNVLFKAFQEENNKYTKSENINTEEKIKPSKHNKSSY